MMSDVKRLLALLTLAGFLGIILGLFFVSIPDKNLDLAKTMVIALIAIVSTIGGYYFGSSDGSARKTELLSPSSPPAVASVLSLTDSAAIAKSEDGFIRLPLLFLLVAFACLIALTGCAGFGSAQPTTSPSATDSPQVKAGKSLLAVKSTIVAAATAIDALCKSGTLAANKCARAKAAYELSKPAYDAAVDSYLLMLSTGGDSGDYSRSLARVQALASDLLAVLGSR
jgi:hypothetical protein